MEHVGKDPGGINFNVYTGDYNYQNSNYRGYKTNLDDPNSDFHIYTLDWNADRIKFMLDNVVYFTYYKHSSTVERWPFDGNFKIVLNLGN